MPPELSTTPSEFRVKGRMVGKRIDAYLAARYPDFSRNIIQKVIDAGALQVNGQAVKAAYKVRLDDAIRVWLPELCDEPPAAEDIPIGIVHDDPDFVVVNKPAGLVTHPAKGNWTGTLVNALQFHFDSLSTIAGENRPGIVHRLDRDTSGLLIVAKEDRTHKSLAAQFEARTVNKEYLAVVSGVPQRDSDYVECPIGPHPTHREKMAIRPIEEGGREAATFYEVLERFRDHALVRCHPKTGRTHQIRIHLLQIGHPIVADKMYSGKDRLTVEEIGGDGPDRPLILRQALHAHTIHFRHPRTGEALRLTAPPPPDFQELVDGLRKALPGRSRTSAP